MTLDELVRQLKLAYGDGLRSVVLFGSAVAGEHDAKKSDYNVLVVVDALPLEKLRAVSSVAKAWADAGNPPPMTFTSKEFRTSADIFPMEYADILERHRLLYGEEPCEGVTVKKEDLRLEVEQQAMGKLLRLRQATMGAGGDGAMHRETLQRSLSVLMVVFRGVARLHGMVPSQDYEALTRSVAERAGFDPSPFVRVITASRGGEKIHKAEAAPLLEAYLGAMERLVAYLNGFRG